MIWILPILSAIFWRMGGAEGYDKLWRRIGSSACIALPLFTIPVTWLHAVAVTMVFIGSISYFGWLTPNNPKEQWFNYLTAAIFSEMSFVVISPTSKAAIIAIIFALIAALGKVAIDKDEDGEVLWWREDVLSELFYGFVICFGTCLNALLA